MPLHHIYIALQTFKIVYSDHHHFCKILLLKWYILQFQVYKPTRAAKAQEHKVLS